MTLAKKLARLRKKQRMSQDDLAAELQVSRQAVSRWEVGKTVPSTENLKSLAELYDVSLEYLLCDDVSEPGSAVRESHADQRDITRKMWRIALAAILALIFVFACIYIVAAKKNAPILLSELEGRVVEPDRKSDFDLEW